MSNYVEYMCRYCGKKAKKAQNQGRPEPGNCPKRSGSSPHSWIVNRRIAGESSGSAHTSESRYIEYMCRYCGKKSKKAKPQGRPDPGACPKRPNGGPHSWIVNRRL